MTRFSHGSIVALLVTSGALVAAAQATSVLHITVTLDDAGQKAIPVARHSLLISDDPPTAAPRLVITGSDGTANVHLRPGSYTVESDRPAPFHGKAYSWTETVKIVAGQDAVLDLNARNAQVEAAKAGEASDVDLESMFEQWQDSVVTVWSDTSYGLGFLVDANGLIATSAGVIGTATAAEVEVTPSLKVRARVLSSNAQKGVAVLSVNPKAVASAKPVRLAYADQQQSPVAAGQQVFSVGVPLHGRKFMTTATVKSLAGGTIDSDLVVDRGNAGAPLFASDGRVIGITTLASRGDDYGPGISGVVRIDQARDAIADATSRIRGVEPPSDAPLPVEPSRPFASDALKAAVQGRLRNVIDYQVKAADFDLTFITPVLTYGVQYRAEQNDVRKPGVRTSSPTPADPLLSIQSFENWADYVGAFPPVLMIRATPKLAEGFWSMLGRGAAETQGIRLPPGAKHVKAGFSSMRVFCGDREIAPIHPFRIERRLAVGTGAESTDALAYEGLYVVDPNALGPQCGTVRVTVFSVKDPDKGDTRIVEPRMVQQVWDDFAGWRSGS